MAMASRYKCPSCKMQWPQRQSCCGNTPEQLREVPIPDAPAATTVASQPPVAPVPQPAAVPPPQAPPQVVVVEHHYHDAPRRSAYSDQGANSGGSLIGDMMEVQGMMDGDPGEVMMGSMMGGNAVDPMMGFMVAEMEDNSGSDWGGSDGGGGFDF